MLLFLDFDGVLHGAGEPAFIHAERLDAVLADYPAVKLVITSSWRINTTLDVIKSRLPSGLADRIDGITPAMQIKWPPYPKHVRHSEIMLYLKNLPVAPCNWVALDDDAQLFPADCQELILCNPLIGFDDKAAQQLKARFEGLKS
jgi:hypothetical protein